MAVVEALLFWLWFWGGVGFFACDEKLEAGSGRLWRSMLWPILMPAAAMIGAIEALRRS